MTPLAVLLEHRDQVVVSVLGSTAAIDFPGLAPFVERALNAEVQRLTNLQRANKERSTQIEEAIRKAADKALTERARRFTSPRAWTGMLYQWLAPRYSAFGLECRPCKRTIRAALRNWTPPTGDAQNVAYGSTIRST